MERWRVIAEEDVLVRRGSVIACMEDEAEHRLVQSALTGDRSAFDALVDRHWRKIVSVIGRFLHDRNDVEDVLQETFVRAFQNLGGFRGESSVQTWLIRIALNISLNRKKGFWRRRVTLTDRWDEWTEPGADAKAQAESALIDGEWERRVHCALGRLPEKHRLPILLHFYEDLTGAEIAAILGWNESTVWSRIYAGCKQLRKSLDPESES